MSLIRVTADNPAALFAASVLLLVLGVAGIVSLPIQMLPNLEYPEINVNTSWRNAAPQEIEASIVEPQETVLAQVPGVVEMSSNVRAGNGNVHLRSILEPNTMTPLTVPSRRHRVLTSPVFRSAAGTSRSQPCLCIQRLLRQAQMSRSSSASLKLRWNRRY